jgi:hypothetical protein
MVSVLRFGTIAPHQGLAQRFAFWETEAIHMVVAPGLNLSLRFKGWARGDAAFEWISNGVAIGREVMPKAPNGRVSIHVDSGIITLEPNPDNNMQAVAVLHPLPAD